MATFNRLDLYKCSLLHSIGYMYLNYQVHEARHAWIIMQVTSRKQPVSRTQDTDVLRVGIPNTNIFDRTQGLNYEVVCSRPGQGSCLASTSDSYIELIAGYLWSVDRLILESNSWGLFKSDVRLLCLKYFLQSAYNMHRYFIQNDVFESTNRKLIKYIVNWQTLMSSVNTLMSSFKSNWSNTWTVTFLQSIFKHISMHTFYAVN